MGEMRSLDVDGQPVRAYFAVPEAGSGPGVLLLYAWWGLTPFFTELADRLAGEGFVVLAPDYYSGRTAATIEEAKGFRSKVDRTATNKMVKSASRYLQEQPSSSAAKIGVVAFSLGCGFALELARSRGDAVAAVVLFYGSGGGKFDRARAAFLGHFAEHDQWEKPKRVRSLEERLRGAGCEVAFHTYPNTGHWFFEEDQPEAYDAEAAQKAWERTIEFLKRLL